jgi:putative transposase
VPSDPDGLRGALAGVHRSYAGIIQPRRKRSGHFRQGRLSAVAIDEEHRAAALRHVALNPVRARLVERAQDWRWSSTGAHLRGKDDGLTSATTCAAHARRCLRSHVSGPRQHRDT